MDANDNTPQANLERARAYLRAIEKGTLGEMSSQFFAPGVTIQWFPNRLSPNGSTSDLAGLSAAIDRGKQIMAKQTYEVRSAMADGDRVVIEATWEGTLAVPLETLPAGGKMRAHFAMFLEFRDGRIVAQRNYDCFEPW
ncbi:MAG TPA: nuclear transport factor 2 family protein [Terriglobales bacterium]